MKSDFNARLIYLNRREHIRIHFLIYFVMLVILRLIENEMGTEQLSVERIGGDCLLDVKSLIGKAGSW